MEVLLNDIYKILQQTQRNPVETNIVVNLKHILNGKKEIKIH